MTVEIDAEFPNGTPDHIKRAVSENANSLALKNTGEVVAWTHDAERGAAHGKLAATSVWSLRDQRLTPTLVVCAPLIFSGSLVIDSPTRVPGAWSRPVGLRVSKSIG